MSAEQFPTSTAEAPLGQLERALIEEFIRGRGHDPQHVAGLSDAERDALLRDASVYASAKLTEVESRSRFVHEIHDGATS